MTDRVLQEVTIHFRLKHPSILELYTFFEDSKYVYLVLELAQNGTLHQYFVDKRETLSEFEAANVLAQVVSGLQYLHSNNIMHRDMSMSNLLLTATMQVKIADFGLATQLDQHFESKHKTLCGTPNYISPEVASRSTHGLSTDVWGLGCLLYTLLVGHPPFDANGVKSTLTQVMLANFTVPDFISGDASDLLQRLLCKDPMNRIQLNEVITHPFMIRRSQQTIDSGIMTQSTGKSLRSRSAERSFRHGMGQVVGSASMYRHLSYQNISNHQQQPSSYYMPSSASVPFNQAYQSEPTAMRIDVAPLNTARLQPTRFKTKTCILSIVDEPPGEVVIEFTKFRPKYNEERVIEVCRISNDGLRIVLCQLNSGKGFKIKEQPFEGLPEGSHRMYSYENLPEKHWKKYTYAHRFVQMVRAKTPKVTFYSELAKCQLMENLKDFEMFLYKGGKVVKNATTNEFKLIAEPNLNARTLEENITQHAEKCYQHCVKIEQTMSLLALDHPCFPIIIGRRPADQEAATDPILKNTFNNYISSSQTPLRTPKISMPAYSLDQMPTPPMNTPLSNYRLPETPPVTPHFMQRQPTIQSFWPF